MAGFQAQPEGPGLILRRAAFLVAYLEQPNHAPRALPCTKSGPARPNKSVMNRPSWSRSAIPEPI
ncbi:MAG TPA: hypothetical protein DIW86_02795 [Pseudomonas sp.]|nr:hypothetical protein [Pseudomonas sp.]